MRTIRMLARYLASTIPVVVLSLTLFMGGADAQPVPTLSQVQTYSSWTLTARAPDISVTTSSSDTTLGASAPVAVVYNTGTAYAYVKLFKTATTVTVAAGIPVPPGGCAFLNAAGQAHIAAIGAGATTLQVALGTGIPGSCGGSSGGGGGSSGAVFGPTAAGTSAANPPVLVGGTIDGTATGSVDNWKVVGGLGFINCANCSGSGASAIDAATMVPGTSVFAPGGGFFQTTATNNPLTNLQQGIMQMTAQRAVFVNPRNSSGVEIGTSGAPIRIDPVGTTTQPVSGTVAVTQSTSPWIVAGGGTAGTPGTSVLTVQGITGGTNISVSQSTAANLNATVVGTGTFAVQATLQASGATAIGTVNPTTTGNWGLTASTQNGATPTNMALMAGQFNTTPTTITTGNVSPLQIDASGNLLVNIKAGAGSGGTAATDAQSFTPTTSLFTPVGGFYNSSQQSLSSGQWGTLAMSAVRSLYIDTPTIGSNLYTALTSPPSLTLNGSPVPWTGLTPGVAQTGTVVAANTDATSVGGTAILTGTGATGAGSPRVTAARDTTTIAGSAPGTAGTPSAQVVSVQGVASGTVLPTNQTQQAGATIVAEPCQTNAKTRTLINFTTTGLQTTPLVAGVSVKKTYICQLIINNAVADNIAVFEATTGTSCGTATNGLYGGTTAATGMNLAANSGWVDGNGSTAVNFTSTANDDICITHSASGQVSGKILTVSQ